MVDYVYKPSTLNQRKRSTGGHGPVLPGELMPAWDIQQILSPRNIDTSYLFKTHVLKIHQRVQSKGRKVRKCVLVM